MGTILGSLQSYYVYHHIEPETGEVKYIGHGWKSRAWVHGGRKTVSRDQEHLDWLEELNSKGFLPIDYVIIVNRGLTKKEACKEEQSQIRHIKPPFNRPQGLGLLKVDNHMMLTMKTLRDEGFSYKQISCECGVSTMTSYRALNGKTKNAK